MRKLALALMIAVPLGALPITPAAAQDTRAATLLVSSSPARDASAAEPVSEVTLAFADKVELFSVTITAPNGSEVPVYQTDYAPETPKLTGKDFAFTLAEPLTQTGTYTLSYLLETKGISSLNGFISFTIEPRFLAPKVVAITPGPGEEIAAPLSELTLELERAADLVMFDLQRIESNGDEVAITTIQSFIDDQTPETAIRTDTRFSFTLAEPLTTPGDYSVAYGYSVTNPDGSLSSVTDMANFTIR
jgi:methionine-rich copper-binding protein CopC